MTRLAPAGSAHPAPQRRQWHRVYFLLALFDVLVVGLGLTLNHRLLGIHKDSVRENGVWEQRLDRYLDLADMAASVNAPGNDVFDSRNVSLETTRMTASLNTFTARMKSLRLDLDELDRDVATTLGRDLDNVDSAMADMVSEARQIFGYFAQNDAALAGTRMASMDRRYHRVNRELAALREDVGDIQRGLFDKQADRASAIQRFELVIAGFVLLMITCATLYGHKIKRELDRNASESQSHITNLERTEAELRAARDELERRVEERTGELASANLALINDNQARRRALESLNRAHAQLQAQAKQLSESNRDLQDFAYVASHDLQEPLRKILAFSDRLESRCAANLDQTGLDYLARMRNASTRMQSLIDDLLVFSRVQTGGNARQEADLGAIVAAVLGDLEVAVEQCGAAVRVDPLPVIEADPSQMRQLFQNLIGNSLKFRRDDVSPEIRITAEIRDAADESTPMCVITVEDNGIGFEPGFAEKIFTVFQRLHGRGQYEGSGIGLAVARRVAERHSGSIRAVGRPGAGATFVVTLPLSQPRHDDADAHDETDASQRSRDNTGNDNTGNDNGALPEARPDNIEEGTHGKSHRPHALAG